MTPAPQILADDSHDPLSFRLLIAPGMPDLFAKYLYALRGAGRVCDCTSTVGRVSFANFG